MLKFSRYRLDCLALDEIRLPTWPGSALRGILGHGLKRTVCVTNLDNCQDCSLRRQCAYTQLFETQVAHDQQGLVLQPLVMTLDKYEGIYSPGECFGFELRLIGKANRHLPYLIPAWQRAGLRGLGKTNARFELDRFSRLDFASNLWEILYSQTEGGQNYSPTPADWQPQIDSTPESLWLELITPYRSKRDGRLVTPRTFEPRGFLISLISRIEALRAQHDPDSPALDLGQLIPAAGQVRMPESELVWTEVSRHSSRQKTAMQMGGVTGRLRLEGPGLELLHPLLELGQWLHVGKNSLFGLGQYRLLP